MKKLELELKVLKARIKALELELEVMKLCTPVSPQYPMYIPDPYRQPYTHPNYVVEWRYSDSPS